MMHFRVPNFVLFLACVRVVSGLLLGKGPSNQAVKAATIHRLPRSFGSAGGQCWDDFEGFNCKILGPTVLHHLGDYSPQPVDDYDVSRKSKFNLNVGRALEVLRRELPLVFMVSDLDFSIFSPQVTVSDGNNRMVMQKNLYSAVVKSLRLASTFSFVYPSMNVKKIEYINDCTTIQCQVDIVLPDSVRIDGQSSWEGMFYFGLDSEGLISTHIFDRKISNLRPTPMPASSYPWLRAGTKTWSGELVEVPFPEIGLVGAIETQNSKKHVPQSSISDQMNDL
jgi:hypothetical protein